MDARATEGSGAQESPGRRAFLSDAWGWAVAAVTAAAGVLALAATRGRPDRERRVHLPDAVADRADRDGVVVLEGIVVLARPSGSPPGAAPDVLDRRCTHLGCPVLRDPGTGGFRCPCHGSRYDGAGRLVSGPARADLARPQVARVPGGWTVRLGSPGTRAAKRGGDG